MTYHVRDAGVWKEITDPQVRDAGVWKEVQEGHVRDAGVWKKFYERVGINITNQSIGDTVIEGNFASVVYECRRNGGAYWSNSSTPPQLITGQWWEAGIGDATIGDGYETMRISGDINWPTVWSALSTTRDCGLSRSALGQTQTSGVIGIRKIGDTGDGVTATITLTVTVVSND